MESFSDTFECDECCVLVKIESRTAHRKWHQRIEQRRGVRRATFVQRNADGSGALQFIDGSRIELDEGTFDGDEIVESMNALLNGVNEALAPYYEAPSESEQS